MKSIHFKTIPFVTRSQMVRVDRLMIEEYGISLLQMMENAGRNLADLAQCLLNGTAKDKKIVVLCGSGNNGGGGVAAARHLSNHGALVSIVTAGDASKWKDALLHQLRAARKMGLEIFETFPKHMYDLYIDALVGYGLKGNLRGIISEWVTHLNNQDVRVLSLDVPSGMDADTGEAQGACVLAEATLSLALPKIGMQKNNASRIMGDLYLADISVPPALYQNMDICVPQLFTESAIVKIIGL